VHTEVSGLRQLVIVTNNWHMPRTRVIFETIFGLPIASGAPSATGQEYSLSFEEVEAHLPENILEARLLKESLALSEFDLQTRSKFSNLPELHGWLFMQHDAYSAGRNGHPFRKPGKNVVSEELLKTY
jgi:hypothetical protein